MRNRWEWWYGTPFVLSVVLDLSLMATPATWTPVLALTSSVLLIGGVALFAAHFLRQRAQSSEASTRREQRLSSLAAALAKFSSGDLTIQSVGAACDDIAVESCVREFNEITSEPCARTFYVGSDSLQEGTMAGRAIGERFRKGRLAVLVGSFEGVNFELRRKGALTELRDHFPEVKETALIESRVDPEFAYHQVAQLLKSDPELGAIYVTEGGSPGGVAKAVADAGKTGKVLVFGHDVTPSTMEAMDKGWISATIFQDPFAQGFDPAVRLFNLIASGQVPAMSRFVTKIRIVTPETSEEFWDSRLKKSRAGDLSRLVAPLPSAQGKRPRIAVLGLANDGFWA